MASFKAPQMEVNSDTWGPTPTDLASQFSNLPFAGFAKSDRLGKCADFTTSSTWQKQYTRRRADESGGNADLAYKIDADEEETFQLVDTAKTQKAQQWKKRTYQPKNKNAQQRNRFGGGTTDTSEKKDHRNQPQRNKWAKARAAAWGKGKHNNRWNNRIDRQASVKVATEWQMVEEFDLAQLPKLKANKPSETDLMWCGFLDSYNDAYDKVTTKSAPQLRRVENKEFYPVTTMDDPVIEKLAVEGAGNVYATDAIVAHLMSAARSIYPWDIVVQKLPGGTLFFDKRDDSQFDFLTVSETSNDPPTVSEDDPDSINTPERLSLEATQINQNFSQQILKAQGRKRLENENPFFDEEESEGMEPASVGYRYRKFTLGSGPKGEEGGDNDIKLVMRCELHGIVNKIQTSFVGKKATKSTVSQYMTAYALNEWDGTKSGGIEWAKKIDAQKGAVLATELKNNSAKLARWSAQSILSGAEVMKLGYVSRASPRNPNNHTVVATQALKPLDFAQQLNMNVQNMWGVMKMLVELMQKQEEGKYVLLRDPNKPVIRVYRVPMEFNESEGESEDEESQEEEEEEEDEE
ncbi:hypothetical protein TrRE_jg9618 [Triparma retinervis]|uniref:Eukaryotic translation initiation factor 3 subunit D n=1 Tax=Triparma retinervis TaxID=2557542 RepID=A0A9W7A5T0_9STRA|nr:hypothetical protein TrRE_jg9618 [Triparma retinervis]